MSGKERGSPPIVRFRRGIVDILDQRALPEKVRVLHCKSVEQVAEAIRTLAVRGAPAIGVAGACGVALAAWNAGASRSKSVEKDVSQAIGRLAATRPTARNLFWAMEALKRKLESLRGRPPAEVRKGVLDEADRLIRSEAEANRRVGLAGVPLIPESARVLTHCNTGPLATGSFGTALGVIFEAAGAGKKIQVFASETRPLFQGARLTCWELQSRGIPATLVVDSAAASTMRREKVDLVIVGADRIAANGDTANKIGTFSHACAARQLGIPFYVAAPLTTFDRALASGRDIPIEERSVAEVEMVGRRRIAPLKMKISNPAFDVTPAELIAAIICDRGILRPPFAESIARAIGSETAMSVK